MLKKSAVLLLLSLTVSADANYQCLQYFYMNPNTKGMNKKETDAYYASLGKNILERIYQLPAQQRQEALAKEIYMPMFRNSFETEYTVQSHPAFIDIVKKIMFAPETITDAERANWSSRESTLQNYFSLNHLTVPHQEREAERIFTAMRPKEDYDQRTGKFELTQFEKVVLRTARVIGRDFDLFDKTKMEISAEAIKKMKKDFLSFFTFGGKKMTDAEFNALYDKYILSDDPLNESRYDLAQIYDQKFVTADMIAARNQRKHDISMKFHNDFNQKNEKELMRDVALHAALKGINQRLVKDADFAASLKHVRLSVSALNGKPFETAADFGAWLEKENTFFTEGLRLINEPGAKQKMIRLIDGMDGTTGYKEQLKRIEADLNMMNPADVKLSQFVRSDLGQRLFKVAREELQHAQPGLLGGPPRLTPRALEQAFKRKLDLLEEVLHVKRTNSVVFDAIFKFKLKRGALNWEEVNEVYNILTYDSKLRPLNLAEFDPTSKFGFCFGRAFFANVILQKHGVHKDSIRKVFVYGPMSGGLFGWGFHVATMVAREDGGFWVIDPTHGKPETLEEWFAKYKVASKDGRIKMDITEAERFGRNFWGTPDMSGNLKVNYASIWNKIVGTDIQYFRDNIRHLDTNNFDRERAGVFKDLFDRILDAADMGY
ncbi:MAG: hypothetical protein JNL11_00995 [Bdellovibrionaceae bacterium]|nr:hypothetical protein [Pseudobdellovibrionaceae bacterium]